MLNGRVYLDHNATAPLRFEAREAMLSTLDVFGNPSSVHAEGRRARAIVDNAREQVAELAGARPSEVVFTSGATESNAWALSRASFVVASAIEHPSVLNANPRTTRVPATYDGIADLSAINVEPEGGVLAMQLANNETGVLQPIERAREIARSRGSNFHVDVVQGAGRVPISLGDIGADTLALSSHKIGGPKGVGALVIRDGFDLEPLISGGSQERRRRAGTENVAAIAGFGAAARAAKADLTNAVGLADLRDEIEAAVRRLTPTAVIAGSNTERLANTSCIAVPGKSAETLVICFDLAGIAISAGAACSSGKVSSSAVLAAMGWDNELAKSAIRISLGHETTRQDVERLLDAWRTVVGNGTPTEFGNERMRLAS